MKYIVTYNEIAGMHCWECAPKPFEYLSDKHRHIFKIRCWFSVSHSDREIEINAKQHEIESAIKRDFNSIDEKGADFGGMSCEMICEYIIEKFGCCACEVLEDGFGGAYVGGGVF